MTLLVLVGAACAGSCLLLARGKVAWAFGRAGAVPFDAASGENLWHYQTGSRIWGAAPMTFMLDGRQIVMIPSGTTLTAFALPED